MSHSCPSTTVEPDADEQDQESLLKTFLATAKHFSEVSPTDLRWSRIRFKQRFPHLPICLLLDGLYAGGPTFTRCEQYGWQFLIWMNDLDYVDTEHRAHALAVIAGSETQPVDGQLQTTRFQHMRYSAPVGHQFQSHRPEEAWRKLRRTPAEILALATGHFQIRFDSS